MVAKLTRSEPLYPKDLETFRDFQNKWQNGTLSEDHLVWRKARRWAQKHAHDYNNRHEAEDLEQSVLLALSTTNFQGLASLDTFIAKIVLHENGRQWKRRGGKLRTELPREMADPESLEFMDAVFARVCDERLINKLMKTDSKVQRRIIKTIISAEHAIGRQRIAESVSLESEQVSRHEVKVILERLRLFFGSFNRRKRS